ncbi:hypothetical protein F4810DRAFT_713262 [Camillea tinctor]|nr:hypothetical protein F4810DRAFT_713262 [Camillea tinctor]
MAAHDPIAIIGMGCRLPGDVDSPDKFWNMLSKGGSGRKEIPTDRWNADSFYHPHPGAKEALTSKHGYFLSQDIAEFDAKFFKIPQYEAHTMDPQQRILLEVAYEALESAGIPLKSLENSDTSVFIGVYARDYDRMGYKDLPKITTGHNSGVGEAILSNRISYLLDLKGASMTIDTGCSGSLVALHQACQTIQAGESRTAIVGGTELLLHPDQSVAMSLVGRGSGYARGEGVGVVILKKLSHAIADGDFIHCVIAGSALNQDGRTSGISFPNAKSQASLMEHVYAKAGIDPLETLYVEAHGTGTEVGDKAEIESLSKIFCEGKYRKSPLIVGSVKSNIGHLEAASGIASLIKSVLILQREQIPPNLDFETPKADLKLDERNIEIPLKLVPLAPKGHKGPKRVSLNSFGYGGTNCHVILEDFHLNQRLGDPNGYSLSDKPTYINDSTQPKEKVPLDQITTSPPENPLPQIQLNSNNLYVLSAASEESINASIRNLKAWLEAHETEPLAARLRDISYTLLTRRSPFSWRAAVVGSSKEQLIAHLGKAQATKIHSSVNIAFVFTGQGAQWAGMGRELIASSVVFRRSIALSDKYLRDIGCKWSLLEELSKAKEPSLLKHSEFAQPSTTAIQIALVDLLREFGIVPKGVIGHSSGEIAACYAAGAVSHEIAINIALSRGLCSAEANKRNGYSGAMMAVGAGEEAILPLIDQVTRGRINVACINSPKSTTVSGDKSGIDELQRIVNNAGMFNKNLQVDTAYHSHHMEKVADQYLEALEGIPSADCENVAFFSSVTGERKETDFSGPYWTRNLVSKVRFSDALEKLALYMSTQAGDNSARVFVEIGPHSVLSGPITQTLGKLDKYEYRYVSALVRNEDAVKSVLEVPALLFQLGYGVNKKAILNLNGEKSRFQVIHNLPPYPWEHTERYWYESRLSRDHRFRLFPPHDLLGLYDVNSNEYEPRWRHHLHVKDQPWMKHHVIDGEIIFPGTGYICMAVEAIRQLSIMRKLTGQVAPHQRAAKYHLRDVSFFKAIKLESDDKTPGKFVHDTEIQLVMSRYNAAENSHWERFKILSYDKDGYCTENCTGLIMAEFVSPVDEVDGSREADEACAATLDLLEKIKENSNETMENEEFYSKFTGNEFGSCFRAVRQTSLGDYIGSSVVHIPDIEELMPGKYMERHVVHPATLDACLHTAAFLAKKQCNNSTLMPIFVSEVSISANITKEAGDELTVASKITPEDKRVCNGDAWALQKNAKNEFISVIEAKGIKLRAVSQFANMTDEELPFSRQVGYRLVWEDDVDQLSNECLREIVQCSSAEISIENRNGFYTKLYEKAAWIYLSHALKKMQSLRDQTIQSPMSKFEAWMEEHFLSESCRNFLSKLNLSEEAYILEQSARGPEGEALQHIGSRLFDIISLNISSSSLLEEGTLHKLHSGPLFSSMCGPLSKFLEMLAFKNPHMDVLEIRAGTGDATPSLAHAFDSSDGLLVKSFKYTDISKDALGRAERRFRKWNSIMSYERLDIFQDPSKQGFKESEYDLVIVHSTCNDSSSVEEMTKRARKLLKPGGRLAVQLIHPTVAMNIMFSIIPEWQGYEECRQLPPLFPPSHWDDMFKRHSFEGIELYLNRHEGAGLLHTTLTARVAGEGIGREIISEQPNHVHVLYNNNSYFIRSLAHNIGCFMRGRGIEFTMGSITDSLQTAEMRTAHLVLDTASCPILSDPSVEAFKSIKNLLTSRARLLWVNLQEDNSPISTAMKALVTGMSRVMRRENPSAQLITLDIREPLPNASLEIIEAITNIADISFWPKTKAASEMELEYAYTKGRLQIPRVRRDYAFNEWTGRVRGDEKLALCDYHQADRPLRLEVSSPGALGSLRFIDDKAARLPLPADEIQIEARAYGVNFRDVFIAFGQMPGHLPMVGEVSGVVTAVGDEMRDQYKPGDKVMGIGAEPFSSQARVKGLMAHIIPDSLNFAEAASVPLVFLTAYHCLVDVAGLEKGQTILIHAASGGVGQAAVQLAQHIGAEVFVTVGSPKKREIMMEQYQIPESHIFSSRGTNFKQGILRMTKNRGVDIVLNSLTGDMLSQTWECLASLGTFIEIGKADMYRRNHLSMAPFDKGLSFVAVDLLLLFEKQPRKMHQNLCYIMEMFRRGILSTKTVTTMPMGKIEDAFRSIANRTHVGKVVVEADSQTKVSALLPPLLPLKLDPEAAYIVVGGLGDIGKRLCQFLAEAGAKHIITFSRSTPDDDTKEVIQKDIRKLGAEIYIVKCDITDKSSIESAAALCCDTMPRVKGIIHGGMVLRDHPLENMEHTDYTTSLGPKVTGTINLHKEFSSSPLDFFITLSSVTAILGTAGQSNFAIGNAFQDAFAQAQDAYAQTQTGKSRTRYISLNLGAFDNTNAIAALPAKQKEIMRKGSVMMSFEELFKALEYCIDPQERKDRCVQLIFGFDRKSMEAVDDLFALSNPLFSLVARKHSSHEGKLDDTAATHKAIKEATTLEKAAGIITEIIVARLAKYINHADLSSDTQFANIGIDSLSKVELQTWVRNFFVVDLRPAEVHNAPTLGDLGMTVALASALLNKDLRPSPDSKQKPRATTDGLKSSPSKAGEDMGEAKQSSPKTDCCPYGINKDPLPDLEQSLQDHITNISHFGTPTQREGLQRAAAEFIAPGSTARKLYAQLVQKAEDPEVDSWVADLYLEARHTRKRGPLVFDGYLATHLDNNAVPHKQSERAALLATTAFRAKQDIEAGTFEAHWDLNTPACTFLWKWLFNSTREPGLNVDAMRKYEGDYCVALRRGHMFKVALREGGENVSQKKLEIIFNAIVEKVGDDRLWDGILTTTNRDIWAKNRTNLLALDQRNVEYLKVVEEAAFVVCLGDTNALPGEEQVRQGFMGDGFNRWFDKSIQFIVAANGTSSHFVNHSQIDGMTIWRLTEWICKAIRDHKTDPERDLHKSLEDVQLEEFTLITSPEIQVAMQDYRKQYIEFMEPREYARHISAQINRNIAEEHKIPLKGVLDLTVQLASRLFFGYNRPSWETLSMSHFHRGRVEMLQLMSAPVARFCDAVAGNRDNATISDSEKRVMLLEATQDIAANKNHGRVGKNFDRLLEVLRVMWPEDEPTPALFEDAVFREAEENYILTNLHDAEVSLDSAYVEQDPKVWIGFSINGLKGQVSRFTECIDEAGRIVRSIIEAN